MPTSARYLPDDHRSRDQNHGTDHRRRDSGAPNAPRWLMSEPRRSGSVRCFCFVGEVHRFRRYGRGDREAVRATGAADRAMGQAVRYGEAFVAGRARRRSVHGSGLEITERRTQHRSHRPGQEPPKNGRWPPPLSGRGRSASLETPWDKCPTFGRFVRSETMLHAWSSCYHSFVSLRLTALVHSVNDLGRRPSPTRVNSILGTQ